MPNISRHAEQYVPVSVCVCVYVQFPSLVYQHTSSFIWQARLREEVNRRQQAERQLLQIQHGSLPPTSHQRLPLPQGSVKGSQLPQGSQLPAPSHQVRHTSHACPSSSVLRLILSSTRFYVPYLTTKLSPFQLSLCYSDYSLALV